MPATLQLITAIAAGAGFLVSVTTLAVVLVKLGRLLERGDRQGQDIERLFVWRRQHEDEAHDRDLKLEQHEGAISTLKRELA